jgi:hypothetical protein
MTVLDQPASETPLSAAHAVLFFEGGEVLRTRRKLFLERPMITIDGQRLPQIIAGGLLVLMAMLGALIDSLAPF